MKLFKKIAEAVLPFTVISSKNIHATVPGYMREFLRITLRNKVYVFGKKVKNFRAYKIEVK